MALTKQRQGEIAEIIARDAYRGLMTSILSSEEREKELEAVALEIDITHRELIDFFESRNIAKFSKERRGEIATAIICVAVLEIAAVSSPEEFKELIEEMSNRVGVSRKELVEFFKITTFETARDIGLSY